MYTALEKSRPHALCAGIDWSRFFGTGLDQLKALAIFLHPVSQLGVRLTFSISKHFFFYRLFPFLDMLFSTCLAKFVFISPLSDRLILYASLSLGIRVDQ